LGGGTHLDQYQVGHTGILDAATKAISATDKAVGTIYKACEEAGYILLITADHGNAEQMINKETGNPHTAHTTNPVPFIMTGDPKKYSFAEDKKDDEPGALCDVAPTILALLVSVFEYKHRDNVDLDCACRQGLDQPEGDERLSPCGLLDTDVSADMTGRSLLVEA